LHSGKSGIRSNSEKVRFQVSAETQVSGKGLIWRLTALCWPPGEDVGADPVCMLC